MKRECGCPEDIVLRCVHFDGRVLLLHVIPAVGGLWFVCMAPEPLEWRDLAGVADHDGPRDDSHRLLCETREDADAAFDAAEAELGSVAIG